jgi:hypothetical protein
VLKHGIPVEVTCDGPTEASSIALIESRKQDRKGVDLHNHGVFGISTGGNRLHAEDLAARKGAGIGQDPTPAPHWGQALA